ncbi:type II toxin-antitoxin system PemK/MazF family toxin [Paenibacillus sp. CMAA1364]
MKKMVYKQGTVLMAFDCRPGKNRLFVVVSNDAVAEIEYNDFLAVSTTSGDKRNKFDVDIDWEYAGLSKPSVIRAIKLYSLDKGDVSRIYGQLNPSDLKKVLDSIKSVF